MGQIATQTEAREHARKNMFLTAVLDTPSGRCTARVRNMSATGALIEAAMVPAKGAPVKLLRGSLQVIGHIAWSASGQCGVRFKSPVIVNSWLSPLRNSHQIQVDTLRDRFASEGNQQSYSPALERTGCAPTIGVAAKLVADLLIVIAGQFCKDPVILANRPLELQAFDVAVQALDAMSSRTTNPTNNQLGKATAACSRLLELLGGSIASPAEPDQSETVQTLGRL